MNNQEHHTGTSKTRVVMLVTNNLRTDSRVRKEAESLAKAGFDTHVVGRGETIPKELVDAPYRLHLAEPQVNGKPILPRLGREDVWRPLRILVNLTVTRSRERKYHKIHGGSRYPDAIRLPEMQSVALALKPDIIHCHDLDTLYAGYHVSLLTGAKLVYDSHELFIELHFLDPTSRKYYAEIESELFSKIDAFVTVSPAVGERLTTKYKSDLEPVVLYNGGTHVVSQVSKVGEPPRLFFQGAFASDRNLVELVRAMKPLEGRATLSLQGWGDSEDQIKEVIKELSLENTVKLVAPCKPSEVVDSASKYDIGIINSLCLDENFKTTLPNKLFDYMCAGLAVATTNLPPIKEILDKHSCGVTYEQRGVEHTSKILSELVADKDAIFEMKKNSLNAASLYAWPSQEEKLVDLYKKIAEA